MIARLSFGQRVLGPLTTFPIIIISVINESIMVIIPLSFIAQNYIFDSIFFENKTDKKTASHGGG